MISKPIGIAKRCIELLCDKMGFIGQNGATFRPQVAYFWLTCTCKIKFLKHGGGEQNGFSGSKPQSMASNGIETDFQNFA